jgi:16S rRNA U516 pseudouridylate synthase RsuA-like enzyme
MKGLHAIEAWLKKNDITVDGVFSTKPAAFVTIDDKAICFDGNADTLVEKVEHFRPYI